MSGMASKKRAPGKGGIPSLLTIERQRPALPEHNRYPTHSYAKR